MAKSIKIQAMVDGNDVELEVFAGPGPQESLELLARFSDGSIKSLAVKRATVTKALLEVLGLTVEKFRTVDVDEGTTTPDFIERFRKHQDRAELRKTLRLQILEELQAEARNSTAPYLEIIRRESSIARNGGV